MSTSTTTTCTHWISTSCSNINVEIDFSPTADHERQQTCRFTSTPAFRHFVVTPWQHALRKAIAHLPKSSLDDSQLAELQILLQEDIETRPISETSSYIARFLADERNPIIRFLSRQPPQPIPKYYYANHMALSLSVWITKLAGPNLEDITCREAPHSQNLRITGDTRTRGIHAALIARSPSTQQHLSLIVRLRRRNEWRLSTSELYALVALADRQRRSCAPQTTYSVHLVVIHTHWARHLSACIPAGYLVELGDAAPRLSSTVAVRRSPWFNLKTRGGQHAILESVFAHFGCWALTRLREASAEPP